MTFSRAAELLGDKCDCEDCENVPFAIREIIDRRKLERRQTGPIKRTQQRSLLGRDGQVSVWCMHMPKNAEPLVEFGSSHRIVWVKQLDSDSSTLKWIGKGIIGSSDEEKGRTKMTDWTEGSFFLVPSNGGKAIGWIHTGDNSASTDTATKDTDASDTAPTEEKNDESYSNAVVYVAKIPLYLVKDDEKSGGGNKSWTNHLVECCRNGLKSFQEEPDDKTPAYYKFSGEESKILKIAFCEAEGVQVKHDATEPPSKKIRLDPQAT